MKIHKRITMLLLSSLAALASMTTMTGCSGSSSDDSEQSWEGVMTASDFATTRYAFEVIGVAPVYFIPETLAGLPGEVTNTANVNGYLYTPTSTGDINRVNVLFSYTTSGNTTPDGPPTMGVLVMDFSGYEGQDDADIITALGFREVTHSLRALSLRFNFVSGTVDIFGDGAGGLVTQPDGDGGQDTDTQEGIYAKTFFTPRTDSI